MSLIGYTPGGSPIFFNGPKTRNSVKSQKLFGCEKCKHKTTKNQLKKNGGKCHQCKHQIMKVYCNDR
jgi:hypothetical protein